MLVQWAQECEPQGVPCGEDGALALWRVGGDFVDLDGLLPFGGDGVAFFHRHGGVFHKHLWAPAAAPGQEVDEVVFADRLGAGRGIGTGLAILNATVDVMHSVPRVMGLSMPVGSSDFQGPGSRAVLGRCLVME